ncbi:MAG: hypothetical protein M1829_000159 [Trizodia sp. TS-e1964]|nr:MAG: hypothetical protein M1829_000159 [Trizodia sp. TS-e1964]
MSLFPRTVNRDLAPLFRLLGEGDNQALSSLFESSNIRAFTPKFDVRETKDAYELQGELPGIARADIAIEFSDTHTLVIKGHSKHTYESSGPTGEGRITGESHAEHADHYQKPTVEDENEGGNQQVSKRDNNKQQLKEGGGSKYRYWVSERSVGEFHRTFNFPSRVDQDNVQASLKDGILHIVVPKSTAPQSKKVTIQ